MTGRGSRNAAKRLMKELEQMRSQSLQEDGIERLGPADDDNLLQWEAVMNGRGVGHGYDGEFLPLTPPLILFPYKLACVLLGTRQMMIC